MATNRVKVITYITQETDQKVEAFMARAGMTKSKTCAIALQLGMEALEMAFNPDWKEFFEAQMKASNE
jgi:hypothetical protein